MRPDPTASAKDRAGAMSGKRPRSIRSRLLRKLSTRPEIVARKEKPTAAEVRAGIREHDVERDEFRVHADEFVDKPRPNGLQEGAWHGEVRLAQCALIECDEKNWRRRKTVPKGSRSRQRQVVKGCIQPTKWLGFPHGLGQQARERAGHGGCRRIPHRPSFLRAVLAPLCARFAAMSLSHDHDEGGGNVAFSRTDVERTRLSTLQVDYYSIEPIRC